MYFARFITISIYFILVNVFAIFINYWQYIDLFFCKDCEDIDTSENIFDYIIVGSGSAGSIIARRLAEDKNVKILILEAGRHGNTLLNTPSMGLLLQKTDYDWQYITKPQSSACLALDNNASQWPMGKIVGGTSMLNNMIYLRGNPGDFDEWFKNERDYSYSSHVLPYIKKLEDKTNKGSLFISDLAFTSILPSFFEEAAKELNFSISEDILHCDGGFGMPKVNIHKGQRRTTAHRLLFLNKHNIHLRTNRHVKEILFHDHFEAYGIKYSYFDKTFHAKATKGVILSAGVIGTPKILLLSGIGPKDHLEQLNIINRQDLPVGENLQDHVTTAFDLVILNQTLGIGIEQMLSPYSAFEYFWNGTGPWTTCGCEYLAFIHTNTKSFKQRADERPDLQFMVMPLGISEDDGVHLRKLIGINDHTWNHYFALLNRTTAMTILPILLHPKSKGTVRLRDNDFRSQPIIDPKYLNDKDDVEILTRGINIIKRLVETRAMKKLGATFNKNVFPGCEHFKFDTKLYWECYVRHLTITSYHPVGTCKMGANDDSSSVVNYDFQVKGTNNLFVIDASVIPTESSGNINGPILILAEMAADRIKYNGFLNLGKCDQIEVFIAKDFCDFF